LAGLTNVGMEFGMGIVRRFTSLTPKAIRPVPLVTGKDLIAMGFTPSPLFTLVLDAVEFKQLNGELESKEAALAYAKKTTDNLNELNELNPTLPPGTTERG
jgi:hypothetical protein